MQCSDDVLGLIFEFLVCSVQVWGELQRVNSRFRRCVRTPRKIFGLVECEPQNLTLLGTCAAGVLCLKLKPCMELCGLRGFSALLLLDLSDCIQLTADNIKELAALTSLQILRYSPDVNIGDTELVEMGALSNLRMLSLVRGNSADMLTDVGMRALSAFEQLECLALDWRDNITRVGFKSLESLVMLNKLSLAGCHQVTNETLSYLKPLTRLRKLDLSNTFVTSAGMQALPFGSITYLNLSGMSISAHFILALVCFERLKTLLLCDTDVTDEGLQAVSALRKLRSLDIAGCVNVTNDGVYAAAKAPQITAIRIRFCYNINCMRLYLRHGISLI